jgi:hypothetical protein
MITIMKDETSIIRERVAWNEYAAPRFRYGSDQERSMHHLLKARVQSAFDRMQQAAKRRGAPALDFSHARLSLMVIAAIEKPCEYCGLLFGLEQFGVVYDVPPEGRHGQPASRGLANVRVCCALCTECKGPMSGSEWRDITSALRAADREVASVMLAALAAGYRQVSKVVEAGRSRKTVGVKAPTELPGWDRDGHQPKGTSHHPGGRQ